MSVIGAVEDAIIARLDKTVGLHPANAWPYRVPTIASYGGQIAVDDAGNPTVMATFNMPALFVAFGDFRMEKALGERTGNYNLDYVVYCAAYNTRNERAQRQGAPHEVGTYQLAEDVAGILANQRLGQPIKPLRVKRIEPLFGARRNEAKAVSVVAVHLTSQVQWEADLPDCAVVEGMAELQSIADGFYLPGENDPRVSAEFNLENPV